MAYPWSQWLRMKKQTTRLSTPLIRICILSGNVFLKDVSLCPILNCMQKGVFEGKQTVVSIWK